MAHGSFLLLGGFPDDHGARNHTARRGVSIYVAWITSMRETGDGHEAFLAATLPHLDAVHNVARNLLRDPGHAEDLVQETYLKAYRGYASFRGGSIRSWLVAICLNTARSEIRKRKARPTETLDADPGSELPARGDTCESALSAIEFDRISAAIMTLPCDQRESIVLMDVAGMTAQEIADVLECPRNTILSRVFRGRRRLAQLLAPAKVAEEVGDERM